MNGSGSPCRGIPWQEFLAFLVAFAGPGYKNIKRTLIRGHRDRPPAGALTRGGGGPARPTAPGPDERLLIRGLPDMGGRQRRNNQPTARVPGGEAGGRIPGC